MTKREAEKAEKATLAANARLLEYYQQRGRRDGLDVTCVYRDGMFWWVHGDGGNSCGMGLDTAERAYLAFKYSVERKRR
uniref:Uncharacterized protein n=1 Tax=viral metagenome TaxID=1070528 RepID=A0A6M3LVM6_9ZZZZ